MNVIDRTLVEEIDCFLHSRLKDKYFNLYETCWRKIKIKENEEVFFDFLYQFLILKNNGEVFSLNLFLKKFYDCFIQIEKNNLQNMFFKQMEKYFDYFLSVQKADIGNKKIKNLLKKINSENVDDAYPYLMQLCEDFEYARINIQMFEDILNMVLMFIKQRKGKKSKRVQNL